MAHKLYSALIWDVIAFAPHNPDECPVVADFRAFPRRWLMTVAHLNRIPGDCARANLKALCNPCHCHYAV